MTHKEWQWFGQHYTSWSMESIPHISMMSQVICSFHLAIVAPVTTPRCPKFWPHIYVFHKVWCNNFSFNILLFYIFSHGKTILAVSFMRLIPFSLQAFSKCFITSHVTIVNSESWLWLHRRVSGVIYLLLYETTM